MPVQDMPNASMGLTGLVSSLERASGVKRTFRAHESGPAAVGGGATCNSSSDSPLAPLLTHTAVPQNTLSHLLASPPNRLEISPVGANGSSRTSVELAELGVPMRPASTHSDLQLGDDSQADDGDDPCSDDPSSDDRQPAGSRRGQRVWEEDDGTRRMVSDAEYRRLRRRITNRQSAQRMRRKRMDDLQTVMGQVNVLQAENDDLRATQRRCVDSLKGLKHEALLWRERALQVVRQNSLFMRQQLLRSEVAGWPGDILGGMGMGQMGMGQMSQMGHSSQWSQSDAASGMGGSFAQGHPTDSAAMLSLLADRYGPTGDLPRNAMNCRDGQGASDSAMSGTFTGMHGPLGGNNMGSRGMGQGGPRDPLGPQIGGQGNMSMGPEELRQHALRCATMGVDFLDPALMRQQMGNLPMHSPATPQGPSAGPR